MSVLRLPWHGSWRGRGILAWIPVSCWIQTNLNILGDHGLSFVMITFLVSRLRIVFLSQVFLPWTYVEPVGKQTELTMKRFYAVLWSYFYHTTLFLHWNELLSWKYFNSNGNLSKQISLSISLVLGTLFKNLGMAIKTQCKTWSIYWKLYKSNKDGFSSHPSEQNEDENSNT